jgi:hypothetical protein
MMLRVSGQKVRPDLDDVIREHPAVEGAYLTGWVVVAEWMTPDGDAELSMLTSEGMTPWTRRGILGDAIEQEAWE